MSASLSKGPWALLPAIGASLFLIGAFPHLGCSKNDGATSGSPYSVDYDETVGADGRACLMATVKGPAARLAVIITDPNGKSVVEIIEKEVMITNTHSVEFQNVQAGKWVLAVKTFDPEKVVWQEELRIEAKANGARRNLVQIALGIGGYAATKKGLPPPDFAALVAFGQDPSIFVSPLSGRQPPRYDKDRKTLTGEVDYIYFALSDLDIAGASVLIAYERPENHNNKGTNVLYADLHVGYLEMQGLQEAIQKTKDYLKEHPAKKPGA